VRARLSALAILLGFVGVLLEGLFETAAILFVLLALAVAVQAQPFGALPWWPWRIPARVLSIGVIVAVWFYGGANWWDWEKGDYWMAGLIGVYALASAAFPRELIGLSRAQ